MTPSHTLDVAVNSTPPRSWRNKEKLEKAIQSMPNLNEKLESIELPVDPDMQATVTDFLDFTEYLPSDMIRSLTLVGKLDQMYFDASVNVHNLTQKYGILPTLPMEKRQDATQLRADISMNLDEAVNVRTLAHAEAIRMAENIERHYNRIKNILVKLQAMADNYPSSSREASPTAALKSKSPAKNYPPKLTLRLDGRRPREGRALKQRNLRITIPGEVLAPYEVDYPSYDEEESDSYESEDANPLTISANALYPCANQSEPKQKLKITNKKEKKYKKDKKDKPPRPPRALGVMGTNVHSSVAGISTSNALAQLQPPPPDAKPGDKELPWLQLNAWELAKLRKRMKKNAIWSPSDTMIARELKSLGRGLEAYKHAVQQAEASGAVQKIEEPPQLRGETVHAEGAISVEAVRSSESQLFNRGMKLNEIKKQKREKELAIAAREAEQAARQMAASAEAMKDLFNNKNQRVCQNSGHETGPVTKSDKNLNVDESSEKNSDTTKPMPIKIIKLLDNKRKRQEDEDYEEKDKEQSDGDGDGVSGDVEKQKNSIRIKVGSDSSKKSRPPPKKSKIDTLNSPLVQREITQDSSAISMDLPTSSDTSGIVSSISSSDLPTESSVKSIKSPSKILNSTVIPLKEHNKSGKKDIKMVETAANSRTRRTPGAPTATIPLNPATDLSVPKRPTSSSRSQKPNPEGITATATATIDRPRRTSTARNTPAPDPRTQGKRGKRPAPGVINTNSGGSTTFSVVKRSTATRKKPGPKKDKKDGLEGSVAQEIFDEIDDEGNIIDPDEPRYCHCNRVSFGTMIGCEGTNCEKEWFHLDCVGLQEIPPRTTKWYCPLCRVTLGIGEKGEVNARGMKK